MAKKTMPRDNPVEVNPSTGDHILRHKPKHAGNNAPGKLKSGHGAGLMVDKARHNKISTVKK